MAAVLSLEINENILIAMWSFAIKNRLGCPVVDCYVLALVLRLVQLNLRRFLFCAVAGEWFCRDTKIFVHLA